MKKQLERIQKEYRNHGITKSMLPEDPITLLKIWMEEAVSGDLPDPNAMAISTVGRDNFPSTRTVLVKEMNTDGLVFYTNYHSRKGKDLEINPFVSALFFWAVLERQVRIEGRVEKISGAESDRYFSTRPRVSQIGAWASPQSEPLESREALEIRFKEIERKFEGKSIPRPSNWGGYRIIPAYFEFWQGRPGRLNDRIAYVTAGKHWEKERLAP
jgi:pyridoxamine 5'-phosphate oxidase